MGPESVFILKYLPYRLREVRFFGSEIGNAVEQLLGLFSIDDEAMGWILYRKPLQCVFPQVFLIFVEPTTVGKRNFQCALQFTGAIGIDLSIQRCHDTHRDLARKFTRQFRGDLGAAPHLYQGEAKCVTCVLKGNGERLKRVQAGTLLPKLRRLSHLDVQRTELAEITYCKLISADRDQRTRALAITSNADFHLIGIVVSQTATDPIAGMRIASFGGQKNDTF